MKLIFNPPFEQTSDDDYLRGYRSQVWIEFESGRKVELCFYTPVRLSQTIEDDLRVYGYSLFEERLVVVNEIVLKDMESAAFEIFKGQR